MKRNSITKLLAVLAVVGTGFSAIAGEAEKCEKKECAAKTECAKSCEDCPEIAAAMKKLPQLTYVIAGEACGCSKAAAEAVKAGKEVKYVVAGKEFCCPTSAKEAHLKAVETFVANFAKPHKCETSGKTFVAGKGYECETHAGTVATTVATAMNAVTKLVTVDGKEFCCETKAGEASKECGKPVEFVVGDQKTQCPTTARMNLAVAKYKAAVQARCAAEKS